MKKKLLNIIMAIAPLCYADYAAAQCTSTITSSDSCAPTVLRVSSGFSMSTIEWLRNGTSLQYSAMSWSPNGTIIAGNNGAGSAANQLNHPTGIAVDTAGAVYLADLSNHRVQKWLPGATTGVTVAGGNGQGSGLNQLNFPLAIFVDSSLNIYVTEGLGHRVTKWAPGATTATVVAGGNGYGTAANQLAFPAGVFVRNGNVYVVDADNSRVQRWAPGATAGVTVAGGNGFGPALNQMSNPSLCGGIYVDNGNNIYITDYSNHRVSRWAPAATAGVTVAGGNGQGAAANQMYRPYVISLDASGKMFIGEDGNNRISLWSQGATAGITVAGGNGFGSALNQIKPTGVYISPANVLYASDDNNRALKYTVALVDTLAVTTPGTYTAVVNGAGGCLDTVTYVVNGPLTATLTPPSAHLCQGDTVTLQANTGAAYTYKWLMNGTTVTADTLASRKVFATSNFSVIVSYSGKCADTSTTVFVTVNPLPVPVITANGPALSTGAYATYSWKLNGNAIAGANAQTYTAIANGTYTVDVTDSNGCSNASSAVTVSGVGVGIVGKNGTIAMYPNPARTTVYLKSEVTGTLTITDVQGRMVIKAKIDKGVTPINIASLSSGLYTVKVAGLANELLLVDKLSIN